MTNANNENNNEESGESYLHEEIIEIDLPATYNDLVEVEGYGVRVFTVFGYRIENCFTAAEEWTDVVYELIDAVNGDWLEADADDLELLADAEDAEVYMKTIDYENYPKSTAYLLGIDLAAYNEGEAIGMAKGESEKKLTAREASAKLAAEQKKARKEKYEKTDDLLALLSWTTQTYKKTGERRYQEWADTIRAELANMHPKNN